MPEFKTYRKRQGVEQQKRDVMIWYRGLTEWEIAKAESHAGSSSGTVPWLIDAYVFVDKKRKGFCEKAYGKAEKTDTSRIMASRMENGKMMEKNLDPKQTAGACQCRSSSRLHT